MFGQGPPPNFGGPGDAAGFFENRRFQPNLPQQKPEQQPEEEIATSPTSSSDRKKDRKSRWQDDAQDHQGSSRPDDQEWSGPEQQEVSPEGDGQARLSAAAGPSEEPDHGGDDGRRFPEEAPSSKDDGDGHEWPPSTSLEDAGTPFEHQGQGRPDNAFHPLNGLQDGQASTTDVLPRPEADQGEQQSYTGIPSDDPHQPHEPVVTGSEYGEAGPDVQSSLPHHDEADHDPAVGEEGQQTAQSG